MPAQPILRSPCIETAVRRCQPLGACLSSFARRAYKYVTVEAPDVNVDYFYTNSAGERVKIVTEWGRQLAVARECKIREKIRQFHVINVTIGVASAVMGGIVGRMNKVVAGLGVLACLKVGRLGNEQVEKSFYQIISNLDEKIVEAETQPPVPERKKEE